MSEELVLRGEVVSDHAEEVRLLEQEVRRLRRELAMANGEIAKAKSEAAKATAALRKQLAPLYRALQSVFGELDAIGSNESESAPSPRVSAVWEAWKSKLGPQCARAIDALMLHSEMDTTRLAIAMGTNRRNIPNIIYKLNQAGLINKNGGRFSLKQL